MAIPKVIHYCWFGGKPKPKLAEKCIRSWKKKCPDYKIVEWNENNFDFNQNLYCKQAYENKKWAFVTDYARLWILYNYGGIYFDTDVKVLKNLDKFLSNNCFFGIEKSTQAIHVNTGIGMGSEKGNPIVKKILDSYEDTAFIIDGKMDITTCTVRNTEVLRLFGYNDRDEMQNLGDAMVYPTEIFSPMEMESGIVTKTKNTHTIHLYNLSWTSKENQLKRKKYLRKLKYKNFIYNMKKTPNKIINGVLGEEKYEKLKSKLKG